MADFEKYDIKSDGSRDNNSDLNQNQDNIQNQNSDKNQNSDQNHNVDQNGNIDQNENIDQQQNSSQEQNSNQNHNNKVPEYSFLAEQFPTGPNRSNPQGVNNQIGQNRPYYYSAEYNSPEYNRPNYNGSDYSGPNNNKQDYNGSGYGGPNNNKQDNNGSGYGRPDNNRPNYNGSDYGRSDNNRPNYNGFDYGRSDNNRQNYSGTSYDRPDINRPDYNRSYPGGSYYFNNANSPYQMKQENKNSYDSRVKSEGSKSGSRVLKFIAKAACFGLIAGLSFYGLSQLYYTINPEAAKYRAFGYNTGNQADEDADYKIGFTEAGDIKVEDQSKISQVTDATIPAIVSISSIITQTQNWFGVPYDQQSEGSGSGIIVGKDEGELLIATNNHVVAGTDKIKVTFQDGTEAEAVIKGADAKADLAVVTVDLSTLSEDTLKAIAVAKLGNSDDIKVGEMSIAIGNALGYGQSITVGYISAKDREVEVSDGYSKKKMILLQTDAAINPGNSGGALLNVEGEVIGINTIKYADYGVEGMGFAIPMSLATPIINELMTREILAPNEQGYLGIVGTDVTEEAANFYKLPMGVFIDSLQEGGPAAKAGLREDDIITHADDLEITAITQLRDYVTSLRVGTEVEITYMRNTNGVFEEGKVTVVLGPNPQLSIQ